MPRFDTSGRATIIALGSRGDVQPMVTLAEGLVGRDVETHVLVMDDYVSLLAGTGAHVHPLGLTMATMARTAAGLRGRLALSSSVMQVDLLRRWLRTVADRLALMLDEVVQPRDLVVSGILTRAAAELVGARRACRVFTVVYSALLPSADPASCLNARPGWLPRSVRLRRANLAWRVTEGISCAALPALERVLGAGRPCPSGSPVVLAASRTLVPNPGDWPISVHQTGHLGMSTGSWVPPAELQVFLDGGEPPVFIGFGSATDASSRTANRLIEAVAFAADRTGVRVLTPRVAGLDVPTSANLMAIDAVPHDWLFPRMAAVVHHGGAGTTMAGLSAGVPSAVVPFVFDQHYHGQRLAALGVGPAPVPVRRVTEEGLANLLDELTGGPRVEEYRARAHGVAELVAKEDGLTATLDLVLAPDRP